MKRSYWETGMKKLFIVLLVLLVLGGMGGGAWYVYGELTRGYTATSRFRIKLDSMPAPDDGSDLLAEAIRNRKLSLQYDFTGKPALAQLIKDIDELHKDLPYTDDAVLTVDGKIQYQKRIEQLRDAITVTEEISSETLNVIRVDVTLQEGDLAARIANKLVASYLRMVRTDLDHMLLGQKKFYHQEVTRYRRKLSELETARLRFMSDHDGTAGLNIMEVLDNPAMIQKRIIERPQAIRDQRREFTDKVKYLTELFADRPMGDHAAIQVAEWKVQIDRLNEEEKAFEANKEKLEVLNRRFFEIRNEWLKIERETQEAQQQLRFWNDQLEDTQRALTKAVSERGVRMHFIEQASPPPVKPKK